MWRRPSPPFRAEIAEFDLLECAYASLQKAHTGQCRALEREPPHASRPVELQSKPCLGFRCFGGDDLDRCHSEDCLIKRGMGLRTVSPLGLR